MRFYGTIYLRKPSKHVTSFKNRFMTLTASRYFRPFSVFALGSHIFNCNLLSHRLLACVQTIKILRLVPGVNYPASRVFSKRLSAEVFSSAQKQPKQNASSQNSEEKHKGKASASRVGVNQS